jgi:FkbM family methyltransferase
MNTVASAARARAIPPAASIESIGWRSRIQAFAGSLLARRFDAVGGRRLLLYGVTALRFARLAHGVSARARIIVGTLRLALAEASAAGAERGRRPPTLRIPVDHGGRRMHFEVAGLSELEVLDEVFLQGEYELSMPEAPRTILDLGSHIGASLVALSAQFPEARLFGVEANRDTFARLRANAKMLSVVELRNVAVTGHDGTVSLRAGRDSWASSVLADDYDRPAKASMEEVPARTLGGLLEELGLERVDLLKVDIEGAEYEAFAAFEHWESIGTIVMEWHGDMLDRPLADLEALLPAHRVSATPLRDAPGRYFLRAEPVDQRCLRALAAPAPV